MGTVEEWRLEMKGCRGFGSTHRDLIFERRFEFGEIKLEEVLDAKMGNCCNNGCAKKCTREITIHKDLLRVVPQNVDAEDVMVEELRGTPLSRNQLVSAAYRLRC